MKYLSLMILALLTAVVVSGCGDDDNDSASNPTPIGNPAPAPAPTPPPAAEPLAVQNLVWGLMQPITGMIADRFGAGRVLVAGAVLYAAGLVFMAYSQTGLGLSLSAGLATYPQEGVDLSRLLRRADQRLQQAKREGRNRAVARDA